MSTLGGVRGGNREEPPYSIFLLRDNLDENGGGNQSLKRRPAAKV
jgi:hypothetical protein